MWWEAYLVALGLGFFKASVWLAGWLHPFLYLSFTQPAIQGVFGIATKSSGASHTCTFTEHFS